MAQRVIVNGNGIRVSKPGFDVSGERKSLLLDIGVRFGQILDHGRVACSRTAPSAGTPWWGATIYYGPYSQTPDVIVQGLQDQAYQYPNIFVGQFALYNAWSARITPGPGSCEVRLDPPMGGGPNDNFPQPSHVAYLIYRKPQRG